MTIATQLHEVFRRRAAHAQSAAALVRALAWCCLVGIGLVPQTLPGQGSVHLQWDPNPEDWVTDYVVYYGTRSGSYPVLKPSDGETNITISNLKPDTTYYLAVSAVSWTGLKSDLSQEITYTVPSAYSSLQIRKQGLGSVLPDLDGRELVVGRRYALRALPGVGQVFLGWSGAVTSASPTLSFSMERGMIIEATFAPSPFPVAKGSYTGLFGQTNTTNQAEAGAITVTVTDKGSYSGRLRLGGRAHPFSGRLALDRSATNTILRPAKDPLTLELSFGDDPSAPATGRVSGGIPEAPLLAWRSFYNAKANPAPFRGTYTLIFLDQPDGSLGPEGAGSASLNIDGSGNAFILGTLADATRVSQRVALSRDGDWPLSIPIRAGQGLLQGWLQVNAGPSNNVSGTARWIQSPQPTLKYYPEGLLSDLQALGTRYTRPPTSTDRILPLGDTSVSFSGGNLPGSFTNLIRLKDGSRVENLSDNDLLLTFNLARGLFSGSVVEPASGKTLRYNGAVFQSDGVGWGLLLGTNRTARVTLGF